MSAKKTKVGDNDRVEESMQFYVFKTREDVVGLRIDVLVKSKRRKSLPSSLAPPLLHVSFCLQELKSLFIFVEGDVDLYVSRVDDNHYEPSDPRTFPSPLKGSDWQV